MLRDLMSFDNTDDVNQIFFGGGVAWVGSGGSIIGPANVTISSPGGRTGPNCLCSFHGSGQWASQIFSDSQPTWIVGAAFYVNTLYDSEIMAVADGLAGPGTTHLQFGAGITSLGGISIYFHGGGGSIVPAGPNAAWRPNSWNYLEMKGTVGATEGVSVRLNGGPTYTVVGNTRQTSNNSADVVALGTNSTGSINCTVNFDDVYILDGQDASGGDSAKTANNDFLGDIRVLCAYPEANGHYADFTPHAGTNYTQVNQFEATITDANYNSSNVAGHIDSFGFPATLATDGKIFGVQLNVIARKDNAGSRVIAPFYRGVSADYPQTADELGMSNTYMTIQAQFDNDPATSATWTEAGLDAGEFGYKMIS
jgi:hypothetical protein